MRKFVFLILTLTSALFVIPTPASTASAGPRPNVMLIYVDDMRADDMAYMDFTRNLFATEGMTFPNAISPHPLCCPARAELMTGQYAHNSGVFHNDGPFGGMAALEANGKFKLTPQWFKSEGYGTAYVGKYLNGYQGGDIAGADYTETLVKGVYAPYDFTTWNNGAETLREGKHTTDWTGDRTSNLISQKFVGNGPFFTMTAFLAPHRMKRNGEWVPPYARTHKTVPLPIPPREYRTVEPGDDVPPSFANPSFNEEDISDKPSVVQKGMEDRASIQAQHTARVLSLYAVDDTIRRMVNNLKAEGVYSNTIIAFTSDNGYLMGEHRWNGKDKAFYEALRVPIMFTGPGVPNTVSQAPVTTVDIPKTLAALAGVSPNRIQDGANAVNASPDRHVLIQSGASDEKFDFRGIFTPRYTYVEHSSGEKEFYDRETDPYELESRPGDPETTRLAGILDTIRTCSGSACVRNGG